MPRSCTFFPQTPRKLSIHPGEIGRKNPFAFSISEKQGPLDPRINYIWALTHTGEIIIGIEEPWNYREILYPDLSDEAWAQQCAFWKTDHEGNIIHTSKQSLGHISLLGCFDPNTIGSAIAMAAGELIFTDEAWVLNNKSGRFRHINYNAEVESVDSIQAWQLLLSNVAQRLSLWGAPIAKINIIQKELDKMTGLKSTKVTPINLLETELSPAEAKLVLICAEQAPQASLGC